jgi:formate/nitrite transporter FocA (FNT family)
MAGKQARNGETTHEKSGKRGISRREVEDIEELSAPRTPVIYEVVRRLGDEEMVRPSTSLWWSGLAAGLSISFSLLAQAILETHLPDTGWRPLVAAFGYSVGFLIVIMGRQQLFTESTITVVLPVLKDFTWANLANLGRLWAIVLVANLIGTLFASVFCTYTPVLPRELYAGMIEVSRALLHLTWWDMLFRAVSSGFIIAAMVWMIPAAESAKFPVITMMTWLIAVGGFTHIVAGSMEAYMLVLSGDWAVLPMLGTFMVPVLIGNVIGGTALFALISYAQVMEEI